MSLINEDSLRPTALPDGDDATPVGSIVDNCAHCGGTAHLCGRDGWYHVECLECGMSTVIAASKALVLSRWRARVA